jgi:hypothetical protein
VLDEMEQVVYLEVYLPLPRTKIMPLDEYDRLTQDLLNWGARSTEYSSFRTSDFATRYEMPEFDMEQVIEKMCKRDWIDLGSWDGTRVRPFREWLDARTFWGSTQGRGYHRMRTLIEGKRKLCELEESARQGGLPLRERLYVEDIDNFTRVRDVTAEVVRSHLRDGYVDLAEERLQVAIERILDEPMHKNDWGGEQNDLYTTNIIVNATRTSTAFVLKGNGVKSKILQIAHCGKNGDQLIRLFRSPAQLFIVQFVGNFSESLIADIEGKVRELRSTGRNAHYCTINGQDTARLLYAYGKL